MVRMVMAGALLAALTGCTMVPKEPDFVVELDGNYKAIADCAYLHFRDQGLQMTHLDTMRMVEFQGSVDNMPMIRMEIREIGPNRTRVISHHHGTIWGRDYFPKRNRPVFERCSRGSKG